MEKDIEKKREEREKQRQKRNSKKNYGRGCLLLLIIAFVGGGVSSYVDEQTVQIIIAIPIVIIFYYYFIRDAYSEKQIDEMFSFKGRDKDDKGLIKNYGTCPKCWRKISMLASKCPYCTADLG
tara:strand:- start:108 stop:476 length:369 start_codon:yes stop_codon:yes gene_type:complete